MHYENFKKKWKEVPLRDDQYAGTISFVENKKIEHPVHGNIIVDLIWIPKINGWRDDRQRMEFYREASRVGIQKIKGQHWEYYKILNQTS